MALFSLNHRGSATHEALQHKPILYMYQAGYYTTTSQSVQVTSGAHEQKRFRVDVYYIIQHSNKKHHTVAIVRLCSLVDISFTRVGLLFLDALKLLVLYLDYSL